MKQVMIVGGTSGLGKELALLLDGPKYKVAVAGRLKRSDLPETITYFPLSMSTSGVVPVGDQLDKLVDWPCDLLIYASGFYQEGLISELSDKDIGDMMLVGVSAPAMLISRYLKKQKRLDGLISITSTSQWTPRRLEPVYTASKAGLAMLSRSLAEDGRIGKILVAAPAGMKTPFWDGPQSRDKNTDDMLDPKWVSSEILRALAMDDSIQFKYKFIKIHRNPARVETMEVLP